MQDKKDSKIFVKCKDYTVSEEIFTLYHDEEKDMLITSPQPDEENLPKYYQSDDYISHTDAKKTLIEKLYQIVKSFTLRKKVKLITKLKKHKGALLDIGAGTGDFLIAAKKAEWNIYGVEPNQDARKLAQKKELELNKNTIELDSHKFDIITMWHVLEHVPNINNQIIELKRLLKPDGYIIIAVPNFKSYDARYYHSFWAAYDVPRHLWHFSRKSINMIFSKHKMNVVDIIPMKFDSFYVSMLSEKYKTTKMNYIKAFWIGLRSNIKAMRSKEYSSLIYVVKASKNSF